MTKRFLYAILHFAFALSVFVQCQDQSGFISIDCGASDDYTDETTGLTYTSDAAFIDTGISRNISPEFKTLEQQYSNVRSFPEGTKNCYTLTPSEGKNRSYLIRASFMYGNYDGESQSPEFDLYLGVNRWDTVKLEGASNKTTKEIIHVISSDYIYVCLVNTDSGTPFISVLELRLLHNKTYTTQSGSLELYMRSDCGSTTNQNVRYRDDVYDRIWSPINLKNSQVLHTSSLAIEENGYEPPWVVMRTAVTPKAEKGSLRLSWNTGAIISRFYIYLHFAEIKELQNQSREFNIFMNDDLWYGPITPVYLSTSTIYSTRDSSGANFEVRINKTTNSTLPPILNAFEIYRVKELPQSETYQNDVDAIKNIKSMYGLKRNWQGDPCLPEAYKWQGLNCSYHGSDSPRITSLNLSSSGLTGEIAPYVSNFTFIKYLDLSNNSLNGTVPDFLSQLPFLRVLNLEQNKLSGSVPMGLVERSNNESLSLSVGENPNLCMLNSCDKKEQEKKKKKNKFVIPVIASVGGFSLLLVAISVFWCLKRRKQVSTSTNMNVESNKRDGQFESTKQQFTYSDILRITNNFERIIGKGGFGTVYHGYLDDNQVAVKMLSTSSAEGYKQFCAEAQLLTRVYHRNLTALVGYCDEGPNMGLIYEYMVNGNLDWHLSDRNENPLSWEERLNIAMDTAQGLEYLHNGCKPQIIHRDVKTTNILLNEELQAKLADFGFSRAFPVEEGDTHVSTLVVGTPGYLDPEYHVSNRLSAKSDVFSFGVVLLEMITGRPAIIAKEQSHVMEWVTSMLSKGDIKNIIDPRLKQEFATSSVSKAVEVAMDCVSPNTITRPTMAQVMVELKQCSEMEMDRTSTTHETEQKELIEMVAISMNTPNSHMES